MRLDGEGMREAALRFLWRQWAQLGGAGHAPPTPDPWVIDPEALLLATLHLGRWDPRLFDEALDWCARPGNGRWLSVQRLKNLARRGLALPDADGTTDGAPGDDGPDLLPRTLAGAAAVLDAHDTGARWRPLARGGGDAADRLEPTPLFLDPATGGPLPLLFPEPDPHFLRAGRLLRPPVRPRGLSGDVPMGSPPCLLLLLRALLGLGPRAEVVAYLLGHPGAPFATGREVARAVGYSPPPVLGALAELTQGGFVVATGKGRHRADAARWSAFLGLPPSGGAAAPLWVDWPRVFAVLAATVAGFERLERRPPASPYLRASRLARLAGAAGAALEGAGLPESRTAGLLLCDAPARNAAADPGERAARLARFVAALGGGG